MADVSLLTGGFPSPTPQAETVRDSSSTSAGTGTILTSNDQWRVFLGVALLIASYVFRVEVVRFTLRLAKRAVPGMLVWIKEFEKTLLLPLSWVVFVLLVWFSTYVMDLAALLDIDPDTIASLIRLLLGVPLIWTVICLCNYVVWGIIRIKGWKRTAAKEDDDYNRVLIITEGIGVIKILLVAYVISSFMFDGIGRITKFDSSQLTTVAVVVIELITLLGAHTWLKNTMGGLLALLDEQVKSGAHVRFQAHEGVVERLFLQCFCIRRYDQGLVYIPNGLILEHSVEIKSEVIDQRTTLQVHLDHGTDAAATRRFIQELDGVLLQFSSERQQRSKSNVLGLEHKPLAGLNFFASTAKAKTLISDEDEHEKPRYWITVAAPYVVQIVYYTQLHRMKAIKAEKTELVFQITELLAKLRLRVYRAARLALDLINGDAESPLRPLSPEPGSDPLTGTLERPSDRFQKFASDGSILRRRRLDLSRAQ